MGNLGNLENKKVVWAIWLAYLLLLAGLPMVAESQVPWTYLETDAIQGEILARAVIYHDDDHDLVNGVTETVSIIIPRGYDMAAIVIRSGTEIPNTVHMDTRSGSMDNASYEVKLGVSLGEIQYATDVFEVYSLIASATSAGEATAENADLRWSAIPPITNYGYYHLELGAANRLRLVAHYNDEVTRTVFVRLRRRGIGMIKMPEPPKWNQGSEVAYGGYRGEKVRLPEVWRDQRCERYG